MYNQNFNPAFYGMGGMMNYTPIKPKVTNPLTQDEFNSLLSGGGGGVNLKITADDKAKGICTHKDPRNGQSSAILQNDGSFKCYICGETFKLVENPEMVEAVTREFLNILQTIKCFYVDIPDNVARSFFAILPLVKQVPGLYKLAQEHFYKFDQAGIGMAMGGNVNPWQAYSAIQGAPNMMGGMMGGNMMMPTMDPTMGGMMNGMMMNNGMMMPGMDPNMMAQMGGVNQQMMGMAPNMMPNMQVGTDAYGNPIFAQQQMAAMVNNNQQMMGGVGANPFVQQTGVGYNPNVQSTAQVMQTNPSTPGVTVPAANGQLPQLDPNAVANTTGTVQTTKTTVSV